MDQKELSVLLKERRGEKSSQTPSLLESIQQEHLDTATIVNSLFKHSNTKITNEDIESYQNIRKLSKDPIVLDLQEQSKYKFNGKYLFIVENQIVAISKDSDTDMEEDMSIDQLKQAIKEELYG